MIDNGSQHLVAAASRGEVPAVDELLQRFLPRLQLFVRLQMGGALRERETSADLVQSVCADLFSHLDGFCYEGEDQFVSWLFTAALNKVREKVRYHGRARRDGAREEAAADAANPQCTLTPSRIVMGHEELARLETAIEALPSDYREVVVLARVLGLGHAEIGRRLGRSEAATRKLLGRALVRLGELVGDDADPP